jgi:hypothetical protein
MSELYGNGNDRNTDNHSIKEEKVKKDIPEPKIPITKKQVSLAIKQKNADLLEKFAEF